VIFPISPGSPLGSPVLAAGSASPVLSGPVAGLLGSKSLVGLMYFLDRSKVSGNLP